MRGLQRSTQTSLAAPLAWAYTALVLYASLYPFAGWRWPPGQSLGALLALPWPPWRDPFDMWSNLLGYLPWGLLVAAAQAPRQRVLGTWLVALLGAAAMSFFCEALQNFLPGRHPSLKDLAMNTLGAGIGATLAMLLQRAGVSGPWLSTRERWFVPRSGGALALLALWPAALLFPAPLPLGLGQIADKLQDLLVAGLEDVPWAEPLYTLVANAQDLPGTLSPLTEGLITALGLFAPCMLAYSVTLPGWRRVLLTAGAMCTAMLAMTLSTLLNFGPRHALAWFTPATVPALAAGALAAMALFAIPMRVATGLALLALAAGVALISNAPSDPYFAQTLQSWEQGRFVHFHGMAHWLGLLWPFLAMAWLLRRLGQRD
jgi:VanZ family protein